MTDRPLSSMLSAFDLGAIENSHRAIDQSWRLLRQPIWPCDRVPATMEILRVAPLAPPGRPTESPATAEPTA